VRVAEILHFTLRATEKDLRRLFDQFYCTGGKVKGKFSKNSLEIAIQWIVSYVVE